MSKPPKDSNLTVTVEPGADKEGEGAAGPASSYVLHPTISPDQAASSGATDEKMRIAGGHGENPSEKEILSEHFRLSKKSTRNELSDASADYAESVHEMAEPYIFRSSRGGTRTAEKAQRKNKNRNEKIRGVYRERKDAGYTSAEAIKTIESRFGLSGRQIRRIIFPRII